MTVRIRAFDHTLVGMKADSREEVMGSNPTAPKLFFQMFTLTPASFEECPFEGPSFTVHHPATQGYQQCEELLWTDEEVL